MTPELEALAVKVLAGTGRDNALDVLIEIALFEPDGECKAVRANSAGTKVIYTYHNDREATFWAPEYTDNRLEVVAAPPPPPKPTKARMMSKDATPVAESVEQERARWLRDLLRDSIQFHIWADATSEDVQNVIDRLSDSDEYDNNVAALVQMPKWCSPCDVQVAVDRHFHALPDPAISAAYEAGRAEGVRAAAEVAETLRIGGGTLSSWVNANESPMSATQRHIATAIRALSKEPTK